MVIAVTGLCHVGVSFELVTIVQHGPGHADGLVRQGHRGPALPAAFDELLQPGFLAIEGFALIQLLDHRSGALDQI